MESQRFTAQIEHSSLKTESCTGAGLIEQSGQLLAVGDMGVFLRMLANLFGQGQNLFQLLYAEVQWIQKVSHELPPEY